MACFNTFFKIDESGVANKYCYVYTNLLLAEFGRRTLYLCITLLPYI